MDSSRRLAALDEQRDTAARDLTGDAEQVLIGLELLKRCATLSDRHACARDLRRAARAIQKRLTRRR